MSSDIENDPSKAATDIFYPDSGTAPVESGLPPKPSTRPSGYSEVATGIPGGAEPDDLPGFRHEPYGDGKDARRTLGDYLHRQTDANITALPSSYGQASPTIDPIESESTVSQGRAFVKTSDVKTLYTEDFTGEGSELGIPIKTYGKGGTANRALIDYEDSGDLRGTYQDPGPSGDKNNPDATGNTNTQIGGVLQRNRFRPGYSFNSNDPDQDMETWFATQRFKGNQAADSLGKYSKEYDGLAMDELTDIAEQLLIRAVGDSTNNLPGTKDGATFNLGFGFPGFQATGLDGNYKMSPDTRFRAANVVKALKTEDMSETENIVGQMAYVDDPTAANAASNRREKPSYGVLNNHLEKFGSALPTSMIVLAAVAAITVLVFALVLAAILDILGVIAALSPGRKLGDGLNPKATYLLGGAAQTGNDVTTLPLGAAYGNDDFGGGTDFFNLLYRYLGIPPLDGEYKLSTFPFVSATLLGTVEFFIGNSINGKSLPQITTNAAGYYVIVARQAIRESQQISDAWNDMTSGGGGLTGAVEGFFGLIDAFRSSATFRFTMVMVQIGDRVQAGPGLGGNRDSQGRYGGLPRVLPENSIVPVTTARLHESIRRKTSQPSLTYAFGALPQIYLRPQEAHYRTTSDGKQKALTQTKGHVRPGFVPTSPGDRDLSTWLAHIDPTDILIAESTQYGPKGQGFASRLSYFEGGRISTEFREAIEEELDTYYVPFYFHDLRTNEILPMPCFVDGISDSYSPKWSEVSGFGRADPVQIYGGTTRKIGFSFYMVATSKDDYSVLYYGINKLVSMVYPQYGNAKQITNSKGEVFDVPYSSVPTASPIIRLRLGELFASNRSPETVRRLFGANKDGFKINDPSVDEADNPFSVPDAELTNGCNLPALQRVALNGKEQPTTPDTCIYVQATIIANLGGEAKLFNFAGCAKETGTGGAYSAYGNSILLPPMDVFVPQGRYKFAFFNLMDYEIMGALGPKFKVEKEGLKMKIINYYVDGNKSAPDGSLKSTLYYVCVPSDNNPAYEAQADKAKGSRAGLGTAPKGVIVPIKSISVIKPGSQDAGVEPKPDPPFPLPFPLPEPPEPLVDDVFFFNDAGEGNLIVEAMRESGGRGIAGAITSLDFAWNDAPWETSADVGRAPQYCKVSLTFAPIHDEPLGLNDDGSLRAAAYPVGKVVSSVMGERFKLPGEPGRGVEKISVLSKYIEDARLANDTGADAPQPPGL